LDGLVASGKDVVAAIVAVLLVGCAQPQRREAHPNPVRPADSIVDSECREKEVEARRFRVIGDLAPPDIDLIMREVAKVSKHPVVRVVTEPTGVEVLKVKYGRGLVQVETLTIWSCESTRHESLFLFRAAGGWRVAEERQHSIECD